MLRTHGIIAGIALVLLIGFGAFSPKEAPAEITPSVEIIDIAFEHQAPLGVKLDMSTLRGSALVTIGHGSGQQIAVSVPADWERKGVRNVPVTEIVSESAMLGFVRWQFPSTAEVTFYAPVAPENIYVHNASDSPLKVTATRVDGTTEHIERSVRLLEDGGKLW